MIQIGEFWEYEDVVWAVHLEVDDDPEHWIIQATKKKFGDKIKTTVAEAEDEIEEVRDYVRSLCEQEADRIIAEQNELYLEAEAERRADWLYY